MRTRTPHTSHLTPHTPRASHTPHTTHTHTHTQVARRHDMVLGGGGKGARLGLPEIMKRIVDEAVVNHETSLREEIRHALAVATKGG